MAMPQTSARFDPSQDAAALLRRLGFVALMVGVPLTAYAGPGGILVAGALGAALLAIAALLDRDARRPSANLSALSQSAAVLALAVLVTWTGLSLAWTPAQRSALGGFAGFGAVLGGLLVTYLALPDRMRSANLYLLPIGTALAASLGLVLGALSGPADGDLARRVARGLSVVVLFTWPAVAWLRSRGRDLEAAALAVLVAAAASVGAGPAVLAALALGAAAYLLAQVPGRAGRLVPGVALAALVVAAPLVVASGQVADLAAWRPLLLGEPVRLLTGHGFVSLPGQVAARLPAGTLGAVWYELGIVGALAVATAAVSVVAAPPASHPALPPSVAAALATAGVLALSGPGQGAPWRIVALAVVALSFLAAERGQFRTRRPRAAIFGRARQA